MRRTVVALAVALTAACGGTTPSTSARSTSASAPSSAPPVAAAPAVPGIAAEAVRLRTDEAVGGQVQVRITDTGNAPFTVTGVALDSPGFAQLPATAVTAAYAPGRTIDLPTPFGDPVCDAAPLPAAAAVTLRRADGAVEQVRLPLAADVLALIHDEECAVLAVQEVVEISVTGLRAEPEAVTGSLTLTRRGGHEEPVTAVRLSRSVLLDATAGNLPLELPGDERTASTPVSFRPATCDPHVLSETKKPYVFPLAVTVADGDEVPVDLPLDQAAKDLLAALVQRVCTPPA
jgi:hypothetical protein